ncbi:MAG: phenylalanine--tRNA ligase beta subunit [Bacillota bacterium]|jgi:phenylalanyl-tRNA synthetase beta chain
MKFSYQWLTTLVDLNNLSPQQVANALNQAGIEVEAVSPLVQATGITTGLVKSRSMIEGSDHLSKVIVDTGHHGIRTIVCGASNIREGQFVLVALPGAVLPKLTIQASTIKGVASEGMVCSLLELGVDSKFLRPDQIEGIEILDVSTKIGDDLILDHLGLNDTIIDLKLLANRPDLWSLEGIAYEVSALLNRPLKKGNIKAENGLLPTSFQLDVQTNQVSQFSIRVLEGVQQTVTPNWMKQYLMGSGIRPISFLVDIGNYVMLLTGQPLHMYDLKKLPSHSLTLSDNVSEKFVALDDKTYELKPGDIVIKSGPQIMCLAGVMGAKVCAVDSSTTDIAIEAAAFDPASIRKTSLRLNLPSDASTRFAKGIDLSQFESVLQFTTTLIQSLTQVKKVYQTVSKNRLKPLQANILWHAKDINQLLNTNFTDTEIMQALQQFHITSSKEGTGYLASIPRHRQDIQGVADLAEELIRLVGFDRIQTNPMPLHIQAGGLNEKQEKVRSMKRYLSSQGIDETLNYTLVESKWLHQFNLLQPLEPLMLKNPLSEERKHVRTDVISSLIQVVQYNMARQVATGKIFEISQIAHRQGQTLQLGLVLFGERSGRSALSPMPFTFYDVKGYIEGLLNLLQIEPSRYQWMVEKQGHTVLHPGRSASLMVQNQKVATIGQLLPDLQKTYDLGKSPVFLAQVNLDNLLELKTSPIKFKPIPRFPSVTRDLAFYISESVSFNQVVKTVKKAGKKLVDQVLLFDIYQGQQLPKGQISMAIRVVLMDEQKTLQEEEINQTLTAIKSALVSECQISLRS